MRLRRHRPTGHVRPNECSDIGIRDSPARQNVFDMRAERQLFPMLPKNFGIKLIFLNRQPDTQIPTYNNCM